MTQPTFVPIAEADQVRPARHLHVPGDLDDRPARPSRGPARLRGRRRRDAGSRLGLRPPAGPPLRARAASWARANPSTTCCSASPSSPPSGRPCSAAPRASMTSVSPSTCGGSSTDAPAELAGARRRAAFSVDRARLRGAACARRLRPRGDAPAQPRTKSAPGGGASRRLGRRIVRRGHDRGDRPARDRGRRPHLHGPGLRSARGPARSCSSTASPRPRGPGATSCRRWAGPGTGPSRPTSAATAPAPARPRSATTPPSTSLRRRHRRWPTPWRWRPSTSWATTGAACWPGSWRRGIPGGCARSASCRRRTRWRCTRRCAAPIRPRPPTARPWRRTARPEVPERLLLGADGVGRRAGHAAGRDRSRRRRRRHVRHRADASRAP